jgi:hypothetical protein
MTLHRSWCAPLSQQYKDIERWIYNGIGTTTYTVNAKGQMTLWSQEVSILRLFVWEAFVEVLKGRRTTRDLIDRLQFSSFRLA